MARFDFEISGGGIVYLIKTLTPVAHTGVDEHLPWDARWCGAVVVEHRYVGPTIGDALSDGPVVR